MKTIFQLLKVQALKIYNPQRFKQLGLKEILKALLMTFLTILLIGYIVGAAVGLGIIGLASLIPSYMLIIATVIIFAFTLLKASDIIFSPGDYNLLMSLPIKTTEIISSRFLTMYIGDFFLTCAIMIPSLIVYTIFAPTNFIFWFMGLTSLFFIPLIPLTVATILSIIITAISSRFKHQNVVKMVLSILLFVSIMVISAKFSGAEAELELHQITDMFQGVSNQLHQIYPLEFFYTNAMIHGSFINYVLFIFISLIIYILFAKILSRFFISINSRLRQSGKQKAYIEKKINARSQLMALYHKDLTRYFSSSLYALNTGIGYIMVLLFAFGVFFSDIESIVNIAEIPFDSSYFLIIPFGIAIMTGMGNTTPASISIEGKEWWIMQMIPAKMKTILDSKMLVNLTLALPTVLISSTLLVLSIKPGILGLFLFYAIPLIYILFQSIVGISLNLAFPKFDWQNETEIVKQGMPIFISIFGSMFIGGIPIVLFFLLPPTLQYIFVIVWLILLLFITSILYRKNNQTNIKTVQYFL